MEDSGSKVVFNIRGDKVYKEDSGNKMLCNIRGNSVYDEDSSNKMIFNSTERFNTLELTAILFALRKI